MKRLIFFLILIVANYSLFSQEALKSVEEEYYDFLSLQGKVERPTLGYRTLSDSVWNLEDGIEHIWGNNNLGTTKTIWEAENKIENWFTNGLFQGFKYRLYGPEWYNSYNTDFPYGQNDGALWQGRGYNTSLTSGIRAEGYGFEITLKPQITWSENRSFETNPEVYPNPYSYTFKAETVYHPIDYVQRYGDSSIFNFSFGDSEIRWNLYTLTMGFGTQSPWLGPAQLNPMLGSNNASPYPKFDIGLRKTPVTIPWINWYIGDIEGRIWTGMLTESDYFDNNSDNNKRMLNAMSASYAPSFIPGFTIGLNRIFMTYWKAENLKYILRLFTTSRSNALSSSGNDEDQKFSVFIDWNFDKVGFEVYGEFGRDDFSSNETTNPFHTAIYTVGAKQILPLPWGLQSELNFEWNNFEMSQDFQFQWPYMGYYSHGFVQQGYTNNGEIIGAGSGSFGNSQYLGYKVYFNKGYVNLYFHRYCPNNNSVYSIGINTSNTTDFDVQDAWYANYETYRCWGINALYYVINDLSLEIKYTFIKSNHHNYTDDIYTSNNISLNLRYYF